MGFVISPDENPQQVSVEIRSRSIIIRDEDEDSRDQIDVTPDYIRRLISFFNENPQYLEAPDGD